MTISRTRGVGRWAAWAAAYALIVNAILTSTIVASVAPDQYASAIELCLNSRLLTGKSTSASADVGGGPLKAMPVHCPLCTPHLTIVDLPSAPSLAQLIAVTRPLSFPAHDPVRALPRVAFHLARGPPHA